MSQAPRPQEMSEIDAIVTLSLPETRNPELNSKETKKRLFPVSAKRDSSKVTKSLFLVTFELVKFKDPVGALSLKSPKNFFEEMFCRQCFFFFCKNCLTSRTAT